MHVLPLHLFYVSAFLSLSVPRARCVVITEANVPKTTASVFACPSNANSFRIGRPAMGPATTAGGAECVRSVGGQFWPMGVGFGVAEMGVESTDPQTSEKVQALMTRIFFSSLFFILYFYLWECFGMRTCFG
uniref:Secreted protein n=1 Tax=Caenorhabditis japonica TaxID=281687 RepID=A0A8R1IP15_CAEJA